MRTLLLTLLFMVIVLVRCLGTFLYVLVVAGVLLTVVANL